MNIKIVDSEPIIALKAEFDQRWSRQSEDLPKAVIFFLVSITTCLGFFYSFNPPYNNAHDHGLIICFILVAFSAYAVYFYFRQRSLYWSAFESYKRSIETKKMVFFYELDTQGVKYEVSQVKSFINWTAFANYNEKSDFIVLIGKKEELVKDIWINKTFITEKDLEVLRSNLKEIFNFI